MYTNKTYKGDWRMFQKNHLYFVLSSYNPISYSAITPVYSNRNICYIIFLINQIILCIQFHIELEFVMACNIVVRCPL